MLKVCDSRGLDDLVRSLRRVAENARSLNGRQTISAGELFNPSFMRSHTRCQSFDEFQRQSPCTLSTAADWTPPAEFEQFVREQTNFSSWQAMLRQAVDGWAKTRLSSGVR